MRLARLLRGAASAGPGSGLRAASPGGSRSLTSDSGSRPAPESGVPGQVDFYARFSPSPLSMKQFLDFGECGPGLGPLCAALRGEMRPLTRAGPGPRWPPLTAGAPLFLNVSSPSALGASFLLAGRSSSSGAGAGGPGACAFSLCVVEKQTGRAAGGVTSRLSAHVCRTMLSARSLPKSRAPARGKCVHTSGSRVPILQSDDKCSVCI